MVRNASSIDGFVVRQRRATLDATNDGSVRNQSASSTSAPRRLMNAPDRFDRAELRRLDKDQRSKSTESTANRQPEVTGRAKIDPEQQLLNDIEDSLNQIDSIAPPESQANGRHQRRAQRHQMSSRPTKPKKKTSKGKIVKRIIIILILAIIGVVGYLAVKAFLAGGKVFNGNPLDILTTKTRLSEDENGRTNILIFGTSGYTMEESAWDGAMLTDSIMVVSIDQDEHNAYMMSLPRDLYVQHTNCPSLGATAGKLNEVFYCAYAPNQDEKAGAANLMAKAGEILGLDIQYYIHADWTALVQAVDAVGGVDVTIESTDPRGIYDSSTGIKYANGEVAHLNGEKALALARARNHNYGDYGLAGGNYDREKNQQKILAALQQKAMSAGTLLNPVAVSNLIDSLGNNLITDFDTGHVQTLADIASNVQMDQIKQLPFVGRDDGGPDLIGSYAPNGTYLGEAPLAGVYDYSEIQSYIAQNMSSDPVVREGATIDVLNGSDQVGLAGEKAEELEEDNYTIGEIANAPANISDKVVIYQLNSDMPGTAAALKDKYGVEPIQGELAGYYTTADFVVVFGEGSADQTE